MMLNLLIVEDNEKQITLYKDAIKEFNESSNIKIESESVAILKEALNKLKIIVLMLQL